MSKKSITISSWNVNCDRRVELDHGYASKNFAKFKLSHRLSDIVEFFSKHKTDIVGLCEVDATYLDDFVTILTNMNYEVYYGAYAPNQIPNYSYYLIVDYDPNALEVVEHHMFWFTSTPLEPLTPDTRKVDRFLMEHGESFEKGSLISTFKKSDGTILIHSMNQYALRNPYKINSSKILAQHLTTIEEKYAGNEIQMVVCGDFNTFRTETEPFDSTILQPFLDVGFEPCRDAKAEFTFCAYPYDLGMVKPEILKELLEVTGTMSDEKQVRKMFAEKVLELWGRPLTSILNWMLVKNIYASECTVETFDMDIEEENLTSIFLEQAKNGKATMLSDHMLLKLKF